MRFLLPFIALRIPKGPLPRLPTNCSPPAMPVDPVDLKGFFQHVPPFRNLHLGWWVELWRKYWEKSSADVYMSPAAASCNSTTSQSLAVVSWATLQGISSRLDHIDHSMLLSNKHGVFSLTFIHPFITASSYWSFTCIFQFVSLSLLMPGRTGNPLGSFLPTLQNHRWSGAAGQSMAGWSVGVKKWC